jgi:hypothetical protein
MSSDLQSLCETEYSNKRSNEKSLVTSSCVNREYSHDKDYLIKSIAEILNQIMSELEEVKNKHKGK